MNPKKSVPVRVDFDFSDSDEDDEEEFEETPPSSPSHQHHAIVEGVAAGIAVEKHHDEKMADHQDATSPVDQEQENMLGHHDVSAIDGGVCVADDADTTSSESSIEHNHKQDENEAMEESKVVESDNVPSVTTVMEDVKVTVFGWYKTLNDRIAARLQHGDADAKTDVERITKEAREELTVIIMDYKDKAHKGLAYSEKAIAELDGALGKVQTSVLDQMAEVETIVKTTSEMDVINKKLIDATEKAKTSIDAHLDESTGVIHEHVKKSKSHAGAIAGTIAVSAAIIGGTIAMEKHHDDKDAAKESDKHHTGVVVVDQGKSTTEDANVTMEVVVVDYVKITVTSWLARLIEQVSARAKQGGSDAAKDIETITAKSNAEITLLLEETAKQSESNTAGQQISSSLTWAKGLIAEQSTQIQAIGIQAAAAKDSTGGVSTMKAQAKATEEQIYVTLNQCDKTVKSTVTVTEEVAQHLIVEGDTKESTQVETVGAEVEKMDDHHTARVSIGTVAGVAAGVCAGIAVQHEPDEKAKTEAESAVENSHEDEDEHKAQALGAIVTVEQVRETARIWWLKLSGSIAARVQQEGVAPGEINVIITKEKETIFAQLDQAIKNSSDKKAAQELDVAVEMVKTLITEQTVEAHAIGIQVIAASDKKTAADKLHHLTKDTEETLKATITQEKVTKVVDTESGKTVDHHEEKKHHHHVSAIVGGVGAGAAAVSAHDAKTDVEDITKETREELYVIIKESKGKYNKQWFPNEKANADTEHQEQENKKTRRRYFHHPSNHPHHPHLGAIADHVSSAVDAIATGIGIKRRHQKNPKTVTDVSPSPSAASVTVATAIPPEPPHFEIVLVNIKKTVEEGNIHCEKKHLDDASPYVALSYRWGELDEQIVPATKDYYARIVSFHLDDFFKLCEAMQHEPDLQDIEYVWVDAICVDQENMEKRKATIYRMNEIYIHAASIVAVPDLHAYHILINTAANSVFMNTIQNYRSYLYYLLVGTQEAQQTLVEIDDAWMDKLGMPKEDSQRRDLIVAATATATTTTTTTATATATATMTNHLNRGINNLSFSQQLMTLMATPGGMMASTVDALKVKDNDHLDRELPSRMIMEAKRFEWQQQLHQRQTDICQSVQFLQSIMEDWSNRTWVISEYHIAKRLTGKLKFWYNQLSCPELYGQRFFEFKFKKTKQKRQQQDHVSSSLQSYPYTKQIIELTSHFNASMDRRLSSRSVLEMMLQTKASKVEDRFHAIIPLAKKYKHFIKDRQSISNLGVSDMLSVRLKLMEWSDTKDRLVLLFSEQRLSSSAVPFLPTFATHFKAIPPRLTKFLTDNASLCNFDVTTEKEENDDDDNDGDDEGDDDQDGNRNNTSGDGDGDVRLVRTGRLNELWLRPRMYCERQVKPHGKSSFFNNLWHDLGIDPTKDRLDAVSIPLFSNYDDMKNNSLWTLDLQLLGSWEKNIWIMYPFDANVKEIKMRSMENQKQTLPQGFRVY